MTRPQPIRYDVRLLFHFDGQGRPLSASLSLLRFSPQGCPTSLESSHHRLDGPDSPDSIYRALSRLLASAELHDS